MWNNAAGRAIEDAQMGIAHEIMRKPADGEGFKLPILVLSHLEASRQFGLLVISQHSDDRDKRVRMFRVVPAVLVSKRNDEIPIARIISFTKAARDFGFDTIYDLPVERHIVVRKIDIPLEQTCLRDDGQSKK